MGLGIRSCQRLCCGIILRIHTRGAHLSTLTHIARIEEPVDSPSSSPLSLSLPYISLSQSHPPQQLPHHHRHHGLVEHIQQWPKYHAKLSERRQCSAAIRYTGKLAYIRAMGRLRGSCPASKRISERRWERKRLEGPEHRRYVIATSQSTAILSNCTLV